LSLRKKFGALRAGPCPWTSEKREHKKQKKRTPKKKKKKTTPKKRKKHILFMSFGSLSLQLATQTRLVRAKKVLKRREQSDRTKAKTEITGGYGAGKSIKGTRKGEVLEGAQRAREHGHRQQGKQKIRN